MDQNTDSKELIEEVLVEDFKSIIDSLMNEAQKLEARIEEELQANDL